MAYGETQKQAIAEIKEATRVHLLMLKKNEDEIPQPITLQNSSIKVANS